MKPKVVWATAVNRAGLWSSKPMRMALEIDPIVPVSQRRWWDASGNFCVERLGLRQKIVITTFASENKHEVEIFIAGVRALADAIKSMVS